MSYANRRWSDGNLYLKLGFKNIGETSPNYQYYTNSGLESRMKYQKHRLKEILTYFDENKTEYQNMLDNGYDRIWDCGNFKFLWERSS